MDKKGLTKIMILILIGVLILGLSLFTYFLLFGPPVEEGECELAINWKIVTVGGKEDFCYNSKKEEIRFTVENGLAVPLLGVYAKIQGKGEKNEFFEEPIGLAGTFIGKVKFNKFQEGPLSKVQLLPVIEIEGEPLACLDQMVERQVLEDCS